MARIPLALEQTPKKTFVWAIDWPGWARSGKDEERALTALAEHAARYRAVAARATPDFPAGDSFDFEVVDRSAGGSGTEFGVPSSQTDADHRPTTPADGERLAALVEAAWGVFAAVAAAAPEELRKGPRGGGRDTSRIVEHVELADRAYAHEMGVPLEQRDKDAPIATVRAAMLDVLRQPTDGGPLAARKWTARYAARRVAWHALDHAWEIEDRSTPDPAG